jgi:hypothetical protein
MNAYLFLILIVAVAIYPSIKIAKWFTDVILEMRKNRFKNYYWITFLCLMFILISII